MKLFLAALLIVNALADKVEHKPQLRARYLGGSGDKGTFFLELNATFNCVKVINNQIRFGSCKQTEGPSVEMFRFEHDGKVRSLANPRKCWKVQGDSHVELTDCDTAFGPLVEFSLDGQGGYGQIKVGDGRCLRDTWDYADPAKTRLFADTCAGSDSFSWKWDSVRYFTMYGSDGGCIVPAYGENAIIFASCDSASDANIITHWSQDDNGNVHSRQDPDKCLQASYDNSIGDGIKMRFHTCKKGKESQTFDPVTTSGAIKLKSSNQFCLVAQGDPPTKDVSEIILKNCGTVRPGRAFGWTAGSGLSD